MKWLSEIFVVCLCLLLGGLWFSHQQQATHIDRLNAAIERHNELLRLSNQEFANEMREEVREEILNQAKMGNKGLLDTLKYLNGQRDHLLEIPDLPATDAWKHLSWMKEACDKQFIDTVEMAVISLDSLQSISSPERVMELLLFERFFLDMLSSRVAWGTPFSRVVGVTSVPIADEILAGDSLHVWIQLPIGYRMDRELYPKVRFQALSGTITHNPGESHAILTLPTDHVLKSHQQEAWLSYDVKVIIPKTTGGYIVLPVEGKVKVIRRTLPMN